MNIGYYFSRKTTFMYSIVLFIIELACSNILPDCSIYRILGNIRGLWHFIYLWTIYKTNTLSKLYFLWFLDGIRVIWWTTSIIFYAIEESTCQMKTFTLASIIYTGILYTLFLVDLPNLFNFWYDEFMFVKVQDEARKDIKFIVLAIGPPPKSIYSFYDYEDYCERILGIIYLGEPSQCSICLETIMTGTFIPKLPCLHTFHRDCFNAWILRSNTCPLCREIL